MWVDMVEQRGQVRSIVIDSLCMHVNVIAVGLLLRDIAPFSNWRGLFWIILLISFASISSM